MTENILGTIAPSLDINKATTQADDLLAGMKTRKAKPASQTSALEAKINEIRTELKSVTKTRHSFGRAS